MASEPPRPPPQPPGPPPGQAPPYGYPPYGYPYPPPQPPPAPRPPEPEPTNPAPAEVSVAVFIAREIVSLVFVVIWLLLFAVELATGKYELPFWFHCIGMAVLAYALGINAAELGFSRALDSRPRRE